MKVNGALQLERAVSQFKRVCILERQLKAAQILLYKYAAAVPQSDRAAYVEATTKIQGKFDERQGQPGP